MGRYEPSRGYLAEPLTINVKDKTALSLGDSTHEGGDIKVYRDSSGNLQLSLDADAASNEKALDVFGGGVFQNYLTVGQTSLHTGDKFGVFGTSYFSAVSYHNDWINLNISGKGIRTNNNVASLPLNIPVTGTDATDHAVKLQIDGSDIIVAQATGDGAGGITNKAVGFFGVTPQTQQSHIVDADGTLADITTKFNTLLADLEGYGLLKAS